MRPGGRARPVERELDGETAAALARVGAHLSAVAAALRAGGVARALGHAIELREAARRVHRLLAGDEITAEWTRLEARIAEVWDGRPAWARSRDRGRAMAEASERSTHALEALARALEEDTEPLLVLDPDARRED